MADITKQSYEEYRIDVDFGLNMADGEELILGNCDIICVDKAGTLVTDTLLEIATKARIVGSESELILSGLQVLIKAGSEAAEPYKYTFYGVTDNNHKWEKDVTMRIRER